MSPSCSPWPEGCFPCLLIVRHVLSNIDEWLISDVVIRVIQDRCFEVSRKPALKLRGRLLHFITRM